VQVNNTEVVNRDNRPNVSQRVGLRTFFINDGAYVDPYEISSVQLFARSVTLSPKTVLDADQLVSVTPLMAFAASGSLGLGSPTVHCTETSPTAAPCNLAANGFDPAGYNPAITASGIYRVGVGEYVVVLDQTLSLSGWDYTTSTQVAASSLSLVNNYVDLWTVKLDSASKYQVITNQFALNEDTFFAFTEPLLLTSSNKLMNKHVRYGEKIDLKVSTEITVQNKNIPESVQNIFKDSAVTTATVAIKKVNQDPTFDGPFTVIGGGVMQITGDNTLMYNWDVAASITAAATSIGFGSKTGTYSVQVTYTLLKETVISPPFYLTVS